jgi:MOSC domain-containing protein YiiM
MAVVRSVCVSLKKGEQKRPVESVTLVEDFGIRGDAHAGSGRQVSLLAFESMERMREKVPGIGPGAFAENLNVAGLNELGLAVGSRFRVGETALLEITQIGKKCHDAGCAIMRAAGTCVMPKEGLFARVLRGGTVKPGDELRVSPAGE